MLADCAEWLRGKDVDDLVDDVFFRRLVSPETVRQAIERWGTVGRRGLRRLLQSMEVWTPGPPPGSQAEMRMIRRLCEQGAPPPDRQINVFDGSGHFVARIDTGWPGPRVGLEYYGERWHGPRSEAHDAARERRLEEAGWDVKIVRNADLTDGGRKLYQWLKPRLLAGVRRNRSMTPLWTHTSDGAEATVP